LAGGAIAEIAPLRATYFLTAPLLLASGAALLVFREPRLHKADEQEPLRRQIVATYRTIFAPGRTRSIVALTVLGSLLMQGMLEFGPLWLVALAVPAFLYGPQWAGLTSALGLGGLLGGQAWVTHRWGARVIAAGIVACCVVLAVGHHALLVVSVQILLTLLVVTASIPVTRRLHDAVPSAIRAGVASGVGTLTWLTFVPFAIVVGVVSERVGVDRAGWVFVVTGSGAALLIVAVLPRPPLPIAQPSPAPAVIEPVFPADRFLPPDDPVWPGHWAIPPADWGSLGPRAHDADALEQARWAVAEMPAPLRQVIVLRDIQGRTPDDVRAVLNLEDEDQRIVLERARGLVRSRLERYLEEMGEER
jgi:hypothetical protein